MIARWLRTRRLHRLHRQVFAIGHTALSIEARLWAALLYAGTGAVLSHTTAAWIWSLIDTEPRASISPFAGAALHCPMFVSTTRAGSKRSSTEASA